MTDLVMLDMKKQPYVVYLTVDVDSSCGAM